MKNMIEELKNTFKSFNEKFSKKDTIAKIRSDNFEKFVQLEFFYVIFKFKFIFLV